MLPERNFMKLLTIIEKIKRFSNQELALYLLIISSFLPFYLFLTLFVLYMILLGVTGKLTQVMKDLIKHPILLLFIGYSFVVSTVFGNYLGSAISILFLMYAIFFSYYQKRLTPDFFHIVLQTVLLLSIFAAGFAFLEHYEIVHKFNYTFLSPKMQVWHQNRAEVTFFNPNYYGIICCFCIMIAFYLLSITKSWFWKFIGAVAIGINLFGLSFTQNRTAFPAIICGAIIYLFTTIRNSKAFWLSIAAFAIGLMFLFSSDIGVRMGSFGSSMEERISIWNAGMVLFKQNPWFGEGPLTYLHSFARIGARYHEHAHSLYIDTLSSYGIIGTVLLLASTITPIRAIMEMSRDPKKRPIVGLFISFVVVMFVHGIFDVAILWAQSAFLFLLVMTSVTMWYKQEENTMPLK